MNLYLRQGDNCLVNYDFNEIHAFARAHDAEDARRDVQLRVHAVCEVCWTSSWEPCPEQTEHAVSDPGGGWMVCTQCKLHARYVEARAVIAQARKALKASATTLTEENRAALRRAAIAAIDALEVRG